MKYSEKYPEFWAAFLNGMPLGVLYAAFAFAIVGVILNALLGTDKRDPLSERSPFRFSWSFFFSDNMARFVKNGLTTVIVIFLSLRFVNELTGAGLSMGYAFIVGLGIDEAIQRLKNYRDKLKGK